MYTVAENLVQLCCPTGWKAELLSDELEYLAEDISKQKAKGVAGPVSPWCLQKNERLERYTEEGTTKQK